MFIYNDDSAIIASNKNELELHAILQEEFSKIRVWVLEHKLSLHVAKTEFIVFGSKPRLHKKELQVSASVGSSSLSSRHSVTYLGCSLDRNLDGESMASKVLNKVNGRSRFLDRKATFLDAVSLRLLANSLVLCCFDYGLGSWYVALKDKLQLSQNRLVRVVLGLTSRDQ